MEPLRSATISSLIWKFFERAGNQIVALVVQIVLARLLVPSVFGALAIMIAFVNIGNIIVQSGLNTALIQTSDFRREDCSTVFWISLALSLVIYVITFFTAPLISDFYDRDDIIWPLRAMMLMVIIMAFNSVQVAIVSRELKFKKLALSTIVAVVLSGAIGIGAAVAGMDLWALVAQQLSYQFFNCLVLFFQVRWFPTFHFDWERGKKFFSFGWKILVSGLLDTTYHSISDIIIGKQFNIWRLGYVSQGKKYPQALGSTIDGAIQPVMLSVVSQIQNDLPYVKRLVRRALKTSTYIVIPLMTLFALVAHPLVHLLLGPHWLRSVPFLQMYCFVYALLPIHTSNLQALNGVGRSDLFLKLEVIKTSVGAVTLFITAFLIRDLYAIVAGYMVTGVICTIINAWPSKRVIGYAYTEQIRDILPAAVLSIVSAAVAYPVGLLGLADVPTILLQTLVMGVVYLGLSKALHVEALGYLVTTGRDLIP